MFESIRRFALAGALLVAPAVHAAVIESPDQLQEPGTSFSMPVSITGSIGVTQFDASASYFSSDLTITGVSAVDSATQDTTCTFDGAMNIISVQTTAINGATNVGDGLVCIVNFSLSASAVVDDQIFPEAAASCVTSADENCGEAFGRIIIVGQPDIDASPASGTPFTINTVPGFASKPGSATVTVSQLGFAPVTVQAQPMTAPFSVTPTGQQTLEQDFPVDFDVICSSPDAGTFTQNLVLTTNDPNEPTLTYPVTCNVTGAEANPSPAPGSTLAINTVQGTPGQAGFSFQNTGDTELAVLPQVLPSPFVITDANGTVIQNSQVPAGATSQYFVRCDTPTAGNYTATLTIETNDENENPVVYDVNCTVGAAPGSYSSNPPPGTQIVVNTTAGATFPGSASLSITANGAGDLVVDFSGLTPPLSIVPAPIPAGAGTPDTIPAGSTRFYDVLCQSADAGVFDQTLTVTTNDPANPTVTYPVQCIVAGAELNLTPAAGTQLNILTPVGVTGSASFVVENTGTVPLTFSTATPAPPWGVAPQSGSVAPGTTQTVNLTCTSATPGTFNTTFNFGNNDFNEPSFSYPVECVVGSSDIDTTPAPGTSIDITAPAFSAGSSTLAIANTGQLPLTVTLSGLTSPLSATPTSAVIAPGATENITIGCASAPPTPVSQTLTLTTNDPDETTLNYPVTCAGIVSGARSIDIVAGDGQSGFTGSDLDPLIVRLTDPFSADGLGVEVPVLFSIQSGDAVFIGSGSIDETVLSGNDGTAAVQVLLGTTPGPVTVTASADGYGSVTFQLQALPRESAVRELTVVSGNNQVAQPNAAGQPLAVRLTQDGQAVANETITWTVVSGSGVTLAARSSLTDPTGLATVDPSFGANPTTSVIEARDTTGVFARFTIVAPTGAPILRIVSGDGQTGGRQTLADAPIVFELSTAQGEPIANATLNLAIIEGAATLPAPTVQTGEDGRASLRLRYGNVIGPVRLQVTALSGSVRGTAIATVFDVVLSKVAGDNQTGAPNTKLPVPLTIAISRPPAGKGLAGAPVTWTVLSGGGTLSNAQTTTDANGRATAELTLGPTPGANQVRATVTGIGEVTFTATTGTAGTIQIITGNNQTLATNESSGPLTVRLVDAAGNPIPNARIRWTPSGDIELSETETRTDANGNATVTALLLQPGGGTVTATAIDAPNAPSVSFTVNGGIAETEGATDSERDVATALDEACPILQATFEAGQPLSAAQLDLLARCRELIAGAGEIPGETRTALEELLADEATAQNNAALIVQASQFDNLKARIAALRSGTQGASFSGLALQTADGALPLSFLPSAILGEGDDGGTSDEVGADFSRWGFFATGTIGQGNRDRGERDPGFDFDTYGLTAGVDYRYSDKLVFGAALGYNQNDTRLDDSDGGLDATGYSLSGYATWYQGNAFYVDSVLTLGKNDYDLERRIRYSIANPGGGTTSIDQIASASPSSDQTSFAISVGKDFARGAWAIGPYFRALYTSVDFDGYEETLSSPNAPGAGLGVVVEDREIKSRQAVIGGKLSYTKSMSWGILIPNAQIEYLREFEDDPGAVVTRFIHDPSGTPIEVETDTVDNGYFNLGFGLSAVFAQGRSAFVYFEHRAGQDRVSYDNLAVGVRIEF